MATHTFSVGDIQSAVTWLCFTPNSEQIITASKDGSLRIWNINGMILLWKLHYNYLWSKGNFDVERISIMTINCSSAESYYSILG